MSNQIRISKKHFVRWVMGGLLAAMIAAGALAVQVRQAQAKVEPATIDVICSSYSFTGQYVGGIPIYTCVVRPEFREAVDGDCVVLVGVFPGGFVLPYQPVSKACPAGGGDGRVNGGHGDHIAAVYIDQDDHAKPDLKLYCVTPDLGTYAGEITQAMIPATPPAKDTLIKTFTACSHPVSLYALTTGELQLNFGPDAEGHTAVMTFTGIPPTNIHYYDLHLYP